jgi:enoyl-CoA hydratase/3-hydroxyacyl-CoA dehydrogenase
VLGLQYFYPPARNRLVEVVPHRRTDARAVSLAWAWQERLGLLPIRAMDTPGFVVNRFFLPWLNEAVRLHEEGLSIATVEWAAKRAFGTPLGPFALMNATSVPMLYQATRSLGAALGAFYGPAVRLEAQALTDAPWRFEGDPDESRAEIVARRLWGVTLHVALELVSEGVASPKDIDQGACVGLRWPTGPFEKMALLGPIETQALTSAVEGLYGLWEPADLRVTHDGILPAPMH